MNIKPIETRYAGCRFRSRLEARWAVFLDTLGVCWEYEPQGFVTPAGPYLPDFRLPGHRVWLEIKGGGITEAELERCQHVAGSVEREGFRFLILMGDIPRHPEFDTKIGPLGIRSIAWTGRPRQPAVALIRPERAIYFGWDGDLPDRLDGPAIGKPDFLGFDGEASAYWLPMGVREFRMLPDALAAARAARFEHGESG